ncbi:MAG: response regulator transcription factor [Clostridia bacterium]|nr:response regulator transcription factor [Clostridia bacterium]
MKLLYAEDERELSEAVTDILTYHNYIVDAVYDGESALAYAEVESYDGIILDIMMPKADGLEVLKKLRQKGCTTPVLLLTAKSQIEDKIEGLDMGADDYLAKPFAMGELLARIRAMLRRRDNFVPDILKFGNIALNLSNYNLSSDCGSATLTKLEFQMMELLMRNRGVYYSTEQFFEKIWGYNSDADIGVVWVYISYLRKHLEKLNANVEIKVKRNIGYTLEAKND